MKLGSGEESIEGAFEEAFDGALEGGKLVEEAVEMGEEVAPGDAELTLAFFDDGGLKLEGRGRRRRGLSVSKGQMERLFTVKIEIGKTCGADGIGKITFFVSINIYKV